MGDAGHDHTALVRVGYDAVSELYRGDDDRPSGYTARLRALPARLPVRGRRPRTYRNRITRWWGHSPNIVAALSVQADSIRT
jgi:hypothetical protein